MVDKEKILVIIPAYNEADSIGDVLQSFNNQYPYLDIVVIDDGSKDDTAKVVRESKLAKLISLPYNIGIGGSVQTGFKYARKHQYKYTLQFDGDGQHMVNEIPKIIDPVIKGEADCVIGSRFIQKSEGNYKPDLLRRIGIAILKGFSFLFIGQRITDQTSGFRAFNTKCISLLSEYYPKDYPEPEVIILLGRNKLKIKEVYTQMRERQGGASSISMWNGPYYIIKVLLAMAMARIRKQSL